MPLDSSQIVTCGYGPATAAEELERLVDRLGGLPRGILLNSMPVFEGALKYLAGLAPDAFEATMIGCYDHDPFAAFLQFPVHMVAQNSRELIRRTFELLDAGARDPVLHMVIPELVLPGTIRQDALSDLG